MIALLPLAIHAGTVQAEFEDFEEFSDFSVYGLSESKTLRIFKAELEPVLEDLADKYLDEDETLTIRFTDIDMAGDIQPWRNTNNADIRYVEAVYPPRLKFTYALKDASGETVMEDEASISDLGFQTNSIAPIRNRYLHFFYETTLLEDWMRKTFRNRDS
ncbi:MAG: DUF3016 domain-containing protein [Oceanipulchritudo sp.]